MVCYRLICRLFLLVGFVSFLFGYRSTDAGFGLVLDWILVWVLGLGSDLKVTCVILGAWRVDIIYLGCG